MKSISAIAAVFITPLPGLALAPASSRALGRLSERSDVLRAVDLLVDRAEVIDHAKNSSPESQEEEFITTSPESLEAVFASSPPSESEHDSDWISSQVSVLESTFQMSVSVDHGSAGKLSTDGQDFLEHLPPILEASHQLAAKAQSQLTAGSETDDQGAIRDTISPTTGLLSERDDVQRAVDLLMGRISVLDLVSISSPESSEASTSVSALSALEDELEKEPTIQEHDSADQKPNGNVLLKHVPPILETFQNLAAKANAYFAGGSSTNVQGAIDADQGPVEKFATNGQALLEHLPPILEASHQLAAEVDVPLAAERINDEQVIAIANQGPVEKFATDGHALLEHLPPILEASLQLAAKSGVPLAAEPSTDEQGISIANQGPGEKFATNGHALLEHLAPILEASHQLAAKVDVPLAAESITDERGIAITNQGPGEKSAMDGQALLEHLAPILEASLQLVAKPVAQLKVASGTVDPSTVSEQPRETAELLSERDDVRRAINSLMGRTGLSDQVSKPESLEDQQPSSALLSQVLEASPQEAAEVDALLEAVSGTDRGTVCERAKRMQVEKLIAGLEARAVDQSTLRSGWLCQRSEVVWVGQSPSRRFKATGGKIRGRLGQLIFKTTGLYQHLLKVADFPGRLSSKSSAASASSLAVNFRRFKLFGMLPGAVVLAGPVTPSDTGIARSRTQLPSENRVHANFDSPRISIGGPMVNLPVLRLGPTSKVHLDTTYLGPRLRISRDATSGKPYVFKHLTEPTTALDAAVTGSWDKAEMWQPLVQPKAQLSAKDVGVTFMASGSVTWVAAAVMSMVREQGPWPDPILSSATYGLAAIGAALATSNDENNRD